MEGLQRKFRISLFNGFRGIFIIAVFTAFAAMGSAYSAESGEKKTDATSFLPSFVITYFYSSIRCPTCHKLERYSSEAIQDHFREALNKGDLVWRTLNIDEPENQHCINDYQLFTKSLILTEIKNGKEVRWKNLDKIWELVGDERAFKDYVALEISAWIKE